MDSVTRLNAALEGRYRIESREEFVYLGSDDSQGVDLAWILNWTEELNGRAPN